MAGIDDREDLEDINIAENKQTQFEAYTFETVRSSEDIADDEKEVLEVTTAELEADFDW